jgi:cyclopropane fatty-acyl-phospholipid synthase-like methyltransferase
MDRDERHVGHDHVDHEHGEPFDTPTMADCIEREGDSLVELFTGAVAEVADLCRERGLDVHRIIDLGCGPGVGSCCLAQRFTDATVVAADASPAMLERVVARTERFGLARRVVVRHVALPDGLAELEPAQIVWASMVLHHIGDEAALFAGVGGLLSAGGLFAIVDKTAAARGYATLLADGGYDVLIDRPLSSSRQLLVGTTVL